MSSVAPAGFVVFIAILFLGIYLTLFGLPGTVIIFLDVLLYALFTGFAQVGWKVLLLILFLCVLAEAIDFMTGLTPVVHKAPVLKRSLWVAALGAALGMMILTPLLWGIGIWGGFFLGGLVGILIVELIRQSKLRVPHQAPPWSFLAMIAQKAFKGCLALIMVFVSLSHIYS